MEKINLPFFYQLGAQLRPLVKMKAIPENRFDIMAAALPVRDSVRGLLEWSVGVSVCRASATAFLNAADDVVKWWQTAGKGEAEKPNVLVDGKFRLLVAKAITFETVLCEELVTLSAYAASKKGIYSTSDLIEHADKVLPISIREKVGPDIVREIQEAGKCMAFDIPTACGFHMIRATEGVLHEYYLAVGKPKKKDKLDNWAAYIACLYELTQRQGRIAKETVNHIKKVLALLQQVKDQDRNQIMHLEVVLGADEAFVLFETAKTAIMTMADKIRVKSKEVGK